MMLRPALLVITISLALAACQKSAAAPEKPDPAALVSAESIAPGYAVRGQIAVEELSAISGAGFRTLINNRPDGEEPGQPTSAELATRAAQLGLDYHYIPVAKSGPTETDARALAAVMKSAKAPILAFCRSGRRAQALKTMADGL